MQKPPLTKKVEDTNEGVKVQCVEARRKQKTEHRFNRQLGTKTEYAGEKERINIEN